MNKGIKRESSTDSFMKKTVQHTSKRKMNSSSVNKTDTNYYPSNNARNIAPMPMLVRKKDPNPTRQTLVGFCDRSNNKVRSRLRDTGNRLELDKFIKTMR